MKINDVLAYLQGNIRYALYYSDVSFLIRKHIKEQIKWRIKIMDKDCWVKGSCKMCGCKTTALQMADKACEKPCYPPMMDKKTWLAKKAYYIRASEMFSKEQFTEMIKNEMAK